ncbi:MAG: ATP-binding protein [Planctomycetota bacterium]|nr:ATP-binding protein [Planctomycetota bacterium]
MRSLRLAQSALADDQPRQAIAQRLQIAQDAMQSMSDLLERAMNSTSGGVDLFTSHRTMREEIQWCLTLVKPMVDEVGLAFIVDLAPEVGNLHAGPLGVVLLNGFRNAIQAIQVLGRPGGVVRVEGRINEEGSLRLRIIDNGAGPDSDTDTTSGRGHGIGLSISHLLVDALDGSLQLQNTPSGRGAILELKVPLRSLEKE